MDDQIFESTPCLILQVLQNPLILKKLFENCSIENLLTCRLVNSIWRDVSTPICLRQNSKTVRFKLDKTSNDYVSHYDSRNTLEDLNNCLEQHMTFYWNFYGLPMTKVWFRDCHLEHFEIQRFLNLHGQQIKKFHFEPSFTQTYPKLSLFRNFLLYQAPNIEHICLPANFEHDDSTTFPQPSTMKLPRLKSILLHNLQPQDVKLLQVIREILTASIFIEKCEFDGFYGSGFEIQYLDIFESSNSLNAIKALLFKPRLRNIELFEQFSNYLPKLEKLDLYAGSVYEQPELWTKASSILSRILESSQQSLKEIRLFQSCGFLREVQWPILDVKKIIIEVDTLFSRRNPTNGIEMENVDFEQDDYLFPSGFKISKIFPQLFKMTLHNTGRYKLWDSFFKFVDSLPTVQSLKIHDPQTVDKEWLGKLSHIFTNLKSLSLGGVKHFPVLAKEIWKFTKLQFISLELCVDHSDEENNSFPELDASFTGFSTETCKELFNTHGNTDIQNVELLRVNSSILDLKDLQSLNVTFYTESGRVENSYNLLSVVTGEFVFKLMPQVEINLSVDSLYGMHGNCEAGAIKWQQKMEVALKSLTPFANVWINDYKVNIKEN